MTLLVQIIHSFERLFVGHAMVGHMKVEHTNLDWAKGIKRGLERRFQFVGGVEARLHRMDLRVYSCALQVELAEKL